MSSRWMHSRRAVAARGVAGSAKARTVRGKSPFRLETLEDRTLMSGSTLHTNFIIFPYAGGGGVNPYGSGSPIGLTPPQVRKAYGYDSINISGIVGDGTGQTVAIVDAFDWPTAYNDLKAFDKQFNLPDPPSFVKLNQNGLAAPLPAADAPGGWGVEESLDVEWVHSMAPMANLILVEANAPTTFDLVQTAVTTAANLPGVSVVSMSFGTNEYAGELSLDSIFTTPAGHAGVTFLASTGDSGAPGGYPAASPNVVAVGGTSLFLNPDNSYQSESGWDGSGGGVSPFELKPAFQSALPYPNRSIPDVAQLADPNTGAAVYNTYDFGAAAPWDQVGGTSLACPLWAGLMAVVNQERVAAGDPVLDGPNQTLPLLYGLPATDFHDITTGDNGFPAGPGYDLVTGRGTPIAPSIVRDLTPLQISVTPTSILSVVEGTPLTGIQVASFTDATGLLPISRYSASISWGDGVVTTSATIATTSNPISYAIFGDHTYTTYGNYKILITVFNSTTGKSGQASTTISVTDASLTPNAATVSGVEGTKFSGVVGTFSDGNPFGKAGEFSASIDWGNGVVTKGVIAALGNSQFSVSGSNTYQSFGTYPVQVSITESGGSTTQIGSTGNVADAPLAASSLTIRSLAGSTITATVASFVDSGPADALASYYANINWGDSTSSSTRDPATTVTIANRGIRYDVQATHTYIRYGNYNVVVTVGVTGGSSATTIPPTQAIVSDAPLAASSANFTVIQGSNYTGLVAGFTSQNTYAVPADFSGSTINWGDGTALSSAVITANGSGVFGISGSHTYTSIGNYPVTAQVTSGGGSSATAKGFATVIYASLTSSGTLVTGIAGQSITDTIATFVDKYSAAKLANFTASVDWGDGQVTDGLVTQPGGIGSGFVVTGTHAWAKPQSYPITVSIFENGDARDVANSTAVLADASLSAAGTTLSPIFEGGLFGGTVGTFTTGNLLAGPSDFVSTIDWGDGTTSNGLAAQIGSGVFSVSPGSPHTFGPQGDYVIGLNVISLGGTRASAVSSLTVNPAPINPTPGNSIQSIAGQTFSGAIGTFTQFAQTPASAFAASIDWGNGDVTAGVVTGGPNGTFVVSGKEIFKQAGQFAVNVTIVNSSGGPTGTMSVPALVTDAATTAQGSPISAVVGQGFTSVVSTLTTDNVYSRASEYNATIDWGDGSSSKGTIVGGGGTFSVYGSHVYFSGSSGFPVTVSTIHSKGDGTPGSVTTSVTSARILLPITGTISAASDSGYSNTDGITNVTQPVFFGKGQPGASVQIYAAAWSNPAVTTKVGTAVIDSLGSWAVAISPLPDGTYVTTAAMTDSFTGIVVSRIGLMSTPLTIVTTGPRVSGVTLNAPAGLLQVVIQAGPGGLNPVGLTNRANYSLGLPVGTGLQSFNSTGLSTAPSANGQVFVNLSYNLGGKKFKTGGYVVTLQAGGITDLAGNPLVEKNLVTFPQATNFPNPNYVAQIDVSKSGAASAPHAYVSLAEQIAAGNFSATVQGKKVVRVPRTQVTTLAAGSTPKPTTIKARSRTH